MKNTIFLMMIAGLMCGCGIEITSEPIEVNVTHTFRFEDIRAVFRKQCEQELPGATNDELDACADDKMRYFTENL